MHRRLWNSCLALTLVLLLVPVVLTPIPPLLDYPNHLAGLYVLAFGSGDPVLGRIYAAHWALIPNMAFDVLVPPLLHLVPVYAAGRLIVASIVVLPFLGVLAYARASFGRVSWWQLGAGLVAYHGLVLLGFLNFDFSLGLALFAAAGWIAWRERYPARAIGLAALAAVLLFFFHLFALVYYLLLIGSRELALLIAAWRETRRAPWGGLFRRGAALALITLTPAILAFLSPTGHTSGVDYGEYLEKFGHFLVPFDGYAKPWDSAAAILVYGGLCALWLTSRAEIAPHAAIAAAILTLIFFAAPQNAMDTGVIQDRFQAMLGFLPFAGARIVNMPARMGRALFAVFAGLFLLRLGSLTAAWVDSRHDVADLRQAIAPVPPGSKVLVAMLNEEDNPHYWKHMRRSRKIPGFDTFHHLPAMLVIEHKAFWPLMFSSPLKQPLRVLPPYERLSLWEGTPPDYEYLEDDDLDRDALEENPYLETWQSDFDYVLILLPGGMDDAPHFLPDRLTYVDGNEFAALYRVKRPQP